MAEILDDTGERTVRMNENKAVLGYQNFEEVREGYIFYIDKTDFIREWWENADKDTLITRPRWFGKIYRVMIKNSNCEKRRMNNAIRNNKECIVENFAIFTGTAPDHGRRHD